MESVCDGTGNLKLVDSYYFKWEDAFFSFGMAYTGKGQLTGEKKKLVYMDEVYCDVQIYGSTSHGRLSGTIELSEGLEFGDLGLRLDGTQETVSLPGESLGAALYRTEENVYVTDDGRFAVRPGEAVVYMDGERYASNDVSLTRNRIGNQEDFRINYYYRSDWIRFAAPYNSLRAGDVLDRADIAAGRLLEICHDGETVQCRRDGGKMADAVVRVMYWDVERGETVIYVCAQFDTAPFTVETVACLSMGETVTEPPAHATYTMQPGEELQIDFNPGEAAITADYVWEILEGSALMELADTRSATCTVKAWDPGRVRLRVTYNYWTQQPERIKEQKGQIFGGTENVKKSRTREYVIHIEAP